MSDIETMPPVSRRQFMWLTALTGVWFAEGCREVNPWDKEKKPQIIEARYGTSIKEALAAKVALEARGTGLGEELIKIGDRRAMTKGSGIVGVDDGFVVLVGGTLILSPFKENHLFNMGKHTFDVRYVPPGVKGENVAPFMMFDVNVVP